MCSRTPAVITSPTAGEQHVYFDGELEAGQRGGGCEGGACYIAVTPQAQLLPSLFCLIIVMAGGGGVETAGLLPKSNNDLNGGTV